MADWRHGWIPLTPKAVRQKNHGRGRSAAKPKAPAPETGRTDELRELANTPAGRREIMRRQRAAEDSQAVIARGAAAAAGFRGGSKKKPYRKTALTRKRGR